MREGSLFADRFTVERLAGTGGMGAVYRALDRVTGEVVALKVMHAGATPNDRFLREGRVLAELKLPGIVRYVAHGIAPDGTPYVAMEWLEGEELTERLRTGLTVREAIGVVRATAHALAPAHARGVVHRDLKPSNIFLVDRDLTRPKILDFGLARLGAANRATQSGVLLGTPAYMAPEQARGERDLDVRADVFALGCVLFECLTGRPPFFGEHVVALLTRVLLEEAPRVREIRDDVSFAIDELVDRMLAKDRAARPKDAQEVCDLLDALDGDALGERAPPSMQSRSLTGSERRLVSVVLAEMPDAQSLDAPTLTQEEAHADLVRMQNTVAPYGATLTRLADGSFVATVTAQGSATDQAAQAARCALALRDHLPHAKVAVSTGQGEIAARLPVGAAAERAATLLRAGGANIVLDDNTAALLDARFEVAQGGVLKGMREDAYAPRTLLGKATPFVGRDRELATLFATWDEVLAEPVARAVVVTAGPGVGKSRLRAEFSQRLGRRGPLPETWTARGDPMSSGAPFGMIGRALRRVAGVLDGDPIVAKREKLRARVAARVPEPDVTRVAEFLGELVGVPFPDDSVQLRAARQDRMLMGDQIRRAFEELVAAETKSRPLLLVLEDLQWGDLSTVKLIDSALRNLADRPWMVLALGRPLLHDLFGLPWAERGAQEIRLGEVSKKASERLVREALGESVPSETVDRIVGLSGGNAFFLEELTRAVAEGRGERLPDTVVGSVQARLEALASDVRRVLRAGSVFGQAFPVEGLLPLLGDPPAPVLAELLRNLVDSELLARRIGSPDEPEWYAFRHALVHEASYLALTDHDRVLGHRLAADWLVRTGSADPSAVADHFERGGCSDRSGPWHLRACEQALEGDDLAGAIAHADRGEASGATGELLGRLALRKAEALAWRGDFVHAARHGGRAMELLAPGTPDWYDAAGVTASAREIAADLDGFRDVAALLGGHPPRDEAAVGPYVVALERVATRLLYLGRYPELTRALDSIEDVIRGRPWQEATYAGWVEDTRSTRAMAEGDMALCLKRMEAAAVLFDRTGDRRNACRERGHVGYAYLELGCYAEAESALRATIEVARSLGTYHVASAAKHNLGNALGRAGRLDDGVRVEREAIAELTKQGDVRLVAAARTYLADLLVRTSHVEEGVREARAAVDGAAGEPMRATALATLANAQRHAGRAQEALDSARAAKEILDRLGALEEGESKVMLAFAEALAAAGHADEARAVASAGKDRVLVLAAKISVPEWRESFLARVRENAALVAWG